MRSATRNASHPTDTTIPSATHSDFFVPIIQEAHLLTTPHHTVNLSRYIQSTEGTHSLIIWILIGLMAGYITGKIMRGAGFGPIVDVLVGIVGAIVGGLLMVNLGYAGSGGLLYTVFVAVIGAIILTWLLRLVTGGRFRNF